MIARLLTLAFAIGATAAQAAPVPFVGCPSDGQTGSVPAPKTGPPPNVAPREARLLAYYRSADAGVLAPRGWHCFGWSGSNGTGIVVAPRPLDFGAVTTGRITGPAVVPHQLAGGTSGRFEIAKLAARAFPAAGAFVARVERENGKPFVHGPFATDKRTFRGSDQLLVTTPAARQGLGTSFGLAPDTLPVDSVLWLHPAPDMDLTALAARLPARLRPAVAAIIREAAPPPRR